MSRNISTALGAAVSASEVSPILLVYLDFAAGPVRVWSGLGDLSWGGFTWQGVGSLGQIEPLSESQNFVANGATLKLSGIPSDLIALALGQHYQGRKAVIYFGALNAAGAVIVDPVAMFGGSMDTMEIDEGGETSTISVRVESEAVSLKIAREWRYTHEDQRIDYPADTFFRYVAGLQDKQIVWKPAT